MKKLSFVLVIFALLSVVAANASDNGQTIRIVTVVGEVQPAFRFELTSGMLENQDQVSLDLKKVTGVDPDQMQVVFVPDINMNDLDLTFTAKLSNMARCFGSYTLKLTAGDFIVTKTDGIENISPTGIEAAIATDVASRHGVDAQLAEGNEINVSFTGVNCVPGDLAVFNVRYPQVPDALPDIYYADISLEVSSNF
jgi:hypothetical protein